MCDRARHRCVMFRPSSRPPRPGWLALLRIAMLALCAVTCLTAHARREPGGAASRSTAQPAVHADANDADALRLTDVPGIGPAMAARLVTVRAQGRFQDWDDLVQRVSGVGLARARAWSDAGLTVNGLAWHTRPAEPREPARRAGRKVASRSASSEKAAHAAHPADTREPIHAEPERAGRKRSRKHNGPPGARLHHERAQSVTAEPPRPSRTSS